MSAAASVVLILPVRRTKPPTGKGDDRYRAVWQVVDRAVGECFACHPNYLTERGRQSVRVSINKRVVGAVIAFLERVRP